MKNTNIYLILTRKWSTRKWKKIVNQWQNASKMRKVVNNEIAKLFEASSWNSSKKEELSYYILKHFKFFTCKLLKLCSVHHHITYKVERNIINHAVRVRVWASRETTEPFTDFTHLLCTSERKRQFSTELMCIYLFLLLINNKLKDHLNLSFILYKTSFINLDTI